MFKLGKIALACGLFSLSLSGAAQTVLKYSDHEPYGNMRTRFIQDVFFKAVEKESNGNLKIEAHWGGEIAKSRGELQAIRDGKTDLIVAVPEYSEKQLPLHQLFKSFVIGPSGEKQVEAIRRAYREIPELNEEFAQNGVKPVIIATGYPAAFFSPKKMNNLSEIKGENWRSMSFWQQDQLRKAGATPVTTRWGKEVTDRLADGSINGLMVNIDSAFDVDADKYAPYGLVSKSLWLGHIYPIVISNDRWASLSDADKQAFERAAETAYAQLGEIMDKSYAEIFTTAKERNTHLRELTADEVKQWGDISQYRQVQQEWAEKQEAQGVANVKKVLQQLDGILNDAMSK